MGMTNQFFSAPRFLTSTRLYLALAALLVGSFSVSVAQEQPAPEEAGGAAAAAAFEELPIIESFDDTRKQTIGKSAIKIKISKDEPLDITDRDFFYGYFFAEMTQLDKLGELDTKRVDFFKNYVMRAKAIPHQNLVAWALQKMEEISSGNYHPAVRFNALLIVGQLNEKESGFSDDPAEPLAAALDVLIAQLEKPDQMDALQLASWIGILRHSTHALHNAAENEYTILEEKKTQIRNQAIALLQQRQPPADRSSEGHVWLQRRAIEVLGTLDKNPDVPVIDEITFYTSDENSPMSLRLTAARSLADFTFDPKTKINAVAEAHALGALAVQACRNEINRVENTRRRRNQGQNFDPGGSANMGAGMASMMEDGPGDMSGSNTGNREPEVKLEEASRVQLARRRLKYQLFYIQQGLVGLMAAADAEGEAEVKEVVDAVDAIMDMDKLIINKTARPKSGVKEREMNEKVKLNDMIKHVRSKAGSLEKIVENAKRSGQPGAAPAPPAGDVPGSD
jgi:hypothetical protein